MVLSTEELSGWTMAQVMQSEAENRAFSKALRAKTSALVNRRLAKQISVDQYTVDRKRANDDAAECRRGREILIREIRRRGGALPLGVRQSG
jgi:hypothetical protein